MTVRVVVLWVMPRPVVPRMMPRTVVPRAMPRPVVLWVTPRPVVPRMMRRLVVLRAMFRLAVLQMFRPVVLRAVIRPVKFLALLKAQTRTLATSIRTAARPLPQRIFRVTLSHTTGRPTKCADAEVHCDHRGRSFLADCGDALAARSSGWRAGGRGPVGRDGGWATEVVRRNWKGLKVPKHAPGRRPC